ncbi:hypothetical protein N7537_010279 [Penicillium hordei]|uniref:Uncharacterized protein n=1 Tax=Penicillium hordei TaxID=40994 RepID=A0AAD6DUB6_9EURO|nr:uncharacterized protein N7537_010279 [Penicillium hordei]KAJ5593375.1 hypothetical protein N7537_010279 [Penicillium hordei]
MIATKSIRSWDMGVFEGQGLSQNQWVSLKITTANWPKSRELQNRRLLERHSGVNLSSQYIVQLLDDFTQYGPNGAHQCLIFGLLGPTVDMVLAGYSEGKDKLEPEEILRMSTQLLRAIELVDDISDRNDVFTCNKLLNSPEKELSNVLGFLEIEPLAHNDGTPSDNGLPTQLVKAA